MSGVSAVSKFLALKMHNWRGQYQRVFSFGDGIFQTLDPATFAVTNAWSYTDIIELLPDSENADQFTITLPSSGGMFSSKEMTLRFSTPHRLPLISELHRLRCIATKNMGGGPPHEQKAKKFTRTGDKRECVVIVGPTALIVTRRPVAGESRGTTLSTYPFKDIRQIRECKDDDSGIVLVIFGRGRLYFVENRSKMISEITKAASLVGLKLEVNAGAVTVNQCRASRARLGIDDTLHTLAEFFVEKHTPKHDRPVTRRLVLNEESVVERDVRTYGVVSLRPLSQIFALVQSWDVAQRLAIEYNDGTTVWYDCSERGTLLSTLLDACHSAGNLGVCVNAAVGGGGAGLRFIPRDATSEEALEASFLKRLSSAFRGELKKAGLPKAEEGEVGPQLGAGVPYQPMVESVARELNANVSFIGLGFETKRALLLPAMLAIISNLHQLCKTNANVPSAVTVTFLQALKRMVSTKVGFRGWTKLPVGKETDKIAMASKLVEVITHTLKASDAGIVYWTLEVLDALCAPCGESHQNVESSNDEELRENKAALLTERIINLLMALLDADYDKDAAISPLVTMVLVRLIERILCTGGNTTRGDTKTNLLMMVAARHTPVLRLLRSKCTAVRESVALLMGTLIRDSPGSVPELIKGAALAEGVMLHQMRVAIFDPSPGRRFVARYLVSLWLADLHTPGMSLLKRIVPSGLLYFLKMPGLTQAEADSLGEANETKAAASNKEEQRQRTRKNRLAALRAKIQSQSKGTSAIRSLKGENFALFFYMATVDHNLPDLIWNQNTKTELRTALEAEEREFERERDLAGSKRVAWNHSEFEVYYPSLDGEIRIGNHYVRLLFDSGGVGDVAVSKLRDPAHFFECLYRRFLRERRASLQALCLRAMSLVHDHHEVKIPPFEDIAHILRVLSTTRHVAIRDRTLLLLRSLVKKKENAEMILRGHVAKGSGLNVEEAIRIIVLFMTLAHTQAEKRSANMIQATLLLTGGGVDASNATPAPAPAPSSANETTDSKQTESKEEAEYKAQWSAESKRRAAELAAEVLASKEWYYRPKGWKTGKTEPDPVTINGLRKLIEEGEINEYTPMRACGMQIWRPMRRVPQLKWQLLMKDGDEHEDSDDEEARELSRYALEGVEDEEDAKAGSKSQKENVAKGSSSPGSSGRSSSSSVTGGSSTFEVAGEGKKVLEPREIGLVALEILEILVGLHRSMDSTGAAVRPPPRAKRLISDRREMQLTHVSQMILTGEPKIVDSACRLVAITCEHNPKACAKLYLTGVFYFALGYTGSNFSEVARMLKQTHLRQHFKGDGRKTLTSDSSLSETSILASLLPECMLCIMENYGPERFAEVFLGNFNTPEVIWKYSMRTHLVKMIDQHVGNVHARLCQNTATRFDLEFGPIPDIRYPELEKELWCDNYYLGNLCDEINFPEWPIRDPVSLLKAILDAWRSEEEKGLKKDENEASMGEAEAMKVLEIQSRIDEKSKWDDKVRTQYRKLARKYHPDRNPEGREVFEKIQLAYELLSSARPQAVIGPDPVSIDLLLRTQCLLFRRFKTELAPYKYAGYRLLLQSLKINELHSLSKNTHILIHASHLAYLTCLCCALNARELTRVKGVERMSKLLIECMCTVTNNTERSHPNIQIASHLLHSLAGLAAFEAARERMANLPALANELIRSTALVQAPKTIHYSLEAIGRMTVDRRLQCLLLVHGFTLYVIPLLLQFDEGLDNTSEGKDGHDNNDADSEAAAKAGNSGQGENIQAEANHSAKLGARAISRMGGYLTSKKLASPTNNILRSTIESIMTPPLAAKLCEKKPTELLQLLNDNCETPLMIWNGTMRKQLSEFLTSRVETLQNGGGVGTWDMGSMLEYSSLASELIVDGVYIRVYNEHPDFVLPHPKRTMDAIAAYIDTDFATVSGRRRVAEKKSGKKKKRKSIAAAADADDSVNDLLGSPSEAEFTCKTLEDAESLMSRIEEDIAQRRKRRGELRGRGSGVMGPGMARSVTRIQMLLQAMINILANHDSVFESFANNSEAIELIFSFLEPDTSGKDGKKDSYSSEESVHKIRELALKIIHVMAPKEICATTFAQNANAGTLLLILRRENELAAAGTPQNRDLLLHILLQLCSSTVFVKSLIELGGLVDLLEILSRVDDAQGLASARVMCARIICKILLDNTHGPKMFLTLSRLVPDGLVHELREDPQGAGAVAAFDLDHETPELIWSSKTRSSLRTWLANEKQKLADSTLPGACAKWSLPDNFVLKYPSIDGELRAAGVYVRVYLKDPKYALREPKRFIDEVLRMFIGRAEEIVGRLDKSASDRNILANASRPAAAAGPALGDGRSDTKQIILTETEDRILTPLTSAAVCIMKVSFHYN